MKKWGLKTSPFILGYIVGPMAELHFRRSLMYSEGSFLPFLTSPISCFFLIVSVISIAFAVREALKKRKIRNA